MKKLRIGVIGLGIGRHHIAGYRDHRAADVVAIADPDEQRRTEIGDRLEIAHRYADAEEMLAKEKLDVVSVATPNKFHAPLTIAALNAGAHVLCEKPMAMSSAEARRMLAAAKKARRRIMINFSYRFTPATAMLRREVDRGLLGEVYFARTVWHRRRGMPGFGGWFGQKALSGGGPLIDLGVHRLDLALWLMGYPQPEWVMGATYDPIAQRIARAQGKKFDVEDLAAGFVRFTNGASLVIEASWAANIAEKELMETRLLGTAGGLVQRNLEGTYKFEAETFVERKGDIVARKLPPPTRPAQSPYKHFIDAIVKDRPHIATGEEGLIVMEILEALYRSAERKAPVKISRGSK